MSHTNETKNLKLSQFINNDQPSWITDYNGDMEKIDNAYGEIAGDGSTLREDIDKNTSDISTLKGNVNALQTQQNTLATDLSNQATTIAGLRSDVNTAENNIEMLQDNVAKLGANRDWIVLGDDWGAGQNSYFSILQSLEPTRKIYTSAAVGAGLTVTQNSFYQLLVGLTGTVTNRENVEAVIIIGGKNDANNTNATKDSYTTALNAISNYCGAQYPNATVYTGVIYGSTTKGNIKNFNPFNYELITSNMLYLDTYMSFCSLTKYITTGSDNLTVAGAEQIAKIIFSCMRNREIETRESYNLTLSDTEQYISSITLVQIQRNNIITLDATKAILVNKPIPKSATNTLTIADVIPLKPITMEFRLLMFSSDSDTTYFLEGIFGPDELTITNPDKEIPEGWYHAVLISKSYSSSVI